jgi:hypothetical protein
MPSTNGSGETPRVYPRNRVLGLNLNAFASLLGLRVRS